MRTLPEQKGKVFAVAFSPDGRWLATGGAGRAVRLWEPGTWTCRRELRHTYGDVTALAFHPGGELLATAGTPDRSYTLDEPVRLWDVATGTPARVLRWNEVGRVCGLAFTPDGERLYACRRRHGTKAGGPVGYWRFAGRSARFTQTRAEGVLSVAVAPDGGYVLEGHWFGGRWDPKEPGGPGAWVERPGRFGRHIVSVDPARSFAVAVSPDGRRAAVSHGARVTLFTPFGRDEPRAVLSGHSEDVLALAFSPDGATLASGGADTTVIFWDPASGAERRRLSPGLGVVNSLAFAPDGLTLAVGGNGGAAVVDAG